jgi:serralysin
MTSPTNSATASYVPNSGTKNIDSLLGGFQWGSFLGGKAGTTSISYSFPWINGNSAVFSGLNGGSYSTKAEPEATQHFGLNVTQQEAAITALTAWSNVANISFSPVNETSANVGDIRIAFSSAASLDGWWGYASYPYPNYTKSGDIWINAKILL